jgi:hypothetical protein
VGVGGVETGRRGVQVLAVDLQAVEAPLADRLADEGPGLLADRLPGRAEVLLRSPRNAARLLTALRRALKGGGRRQSVAVLRRDLRLDG